MELVRILSNRSVKCLVLQVRSTLFSLCSLSEAVGGESQRVQHLLRDVCKLESTHFAFAAILADGRVVTWGQPEDGGDSH